MTRILFAFIFLVLFGCKNPETEVYQLLNDSFLEIADTVTYQHNNFFGISGGATIPYDKHKKFVIAYDDSFAFYDNSFAVNSYIENDIRAFVKDNDINPQILNNESPIKIFNPSKLSNTGQFVFKIEERGNVYKNNSYVGYLRFYKPFIFKKEAILTYDKSSGPKTGYICLLYLKKTDDKWNIIKREVLLRW